MIITEQQLQDAESFLHDGRHGDVMPVFEGMAHDLEAAYDFDKIVSYDEPYEKLIYLHLSEQDPSLALSDDVMEVDEQIGRVYRALAFCYIQTQELDKAMQALEKAVAVNPMDASARLNLAELYRVHEDTKPWLANSHEVFARAYRPEHLVRAYINFAHAFVSAGEYRVALAALKCARAFGIADDNNNHLEMLNSRLAEAGVETSEELSDDEMRELLAQHNLPCGANTAVAVALLVVADMHNRAGNIEEAVDMVCMCNELVGLQLTEKLAHAVMDSPEDGQAEASEAAEASAADATGTADKADEV